jgi:uncharacterized protein HemX
MKYKKMAYSLVVLLAAFAIGAAAQHSEHHPAQAAAKPEAKMQSVPTGDMMAHHQEMEKLTSQLLQSFTALENEKDPSAIKKLQAEHRALLEQLQGKVKERAEMMQKMSEHMKTCPMMKSEHKHE